MDLELEASQWISVGVCACVLILGTFLTGKPRRWFRGVVRALLAAIFVSLLAAAGGLLFLDLPIIVRAFTKNEELTLTFFWAYSGLTGLILALAQQAIAAWNARR